jgi:phosphate starvation-inducible protein PhoH
MAKKRVQKRFTSQVNIVEFQQPKLIKPKRYSVTLNPRNQSQKEYVAMLQDEDTSIVFAVGPAGTGKAQPLTAKIKIPGGWSTMGDIQRGDMVVTPNGDTAKVVDLFPQGIKDTYILELKDGRKTECCGDHLWEVFYTDYWEKPRIMSTVDIIKFQAGKCKPMKIRLPEHEKQDDIELPIDPYVLGALLGDGSFATYPRIGFSTADSYMLDKINSLCADDGYFAHTSNYDYSYRSNTPRTTSYNKGNFSTQLQQHINELNLFGSKSDTKFIPDVYLHASKSQKIRLLQGMLDTDGYASARNELVYTTVSKAMCDSFVYLIRSIGGAAKVKSYVGSYVNDGIMIEGKLTYDITVCYHNKTELVSIPRKRDRLSNDCQYSKKRTMSIKSITPSGSKECQCILIDSAEHLYVTDDFIVTHNTMLAVQYGIKLFQEGLIDKIIVTRPAVSVDEELGFLPGTLNEKMAPWTRPIFDVFGEYYHQTDIAKFLAEGDIEISPLSYMRGRTFKNAYIVADEVQGTTVNQMKMLLTRIGDGSKMVVTGDLNQADRLGENGLDDFISRISDHKCKLIDVIMFDHTDIERNPVVKEVLSIYGDDTG